MLYYRNMRAKITALFFVIIISVAAVVFISRNYLRPSDSSAASASRTDVSARSDAAVPRLTSNTAASASGDFPLEEGTQVSFVSLGSDETLVSSLTADLDGDAFEDQVSVIRTISSPYLSILITLYNPTLNDYERETTLRTQVSQAQSFSCITIDLIGDHSTSLVYQGFLSNGNSVLEAFLISNDDGVFELRNIASLNGDGAVFVEQSERYDAYETLHATGVSFPIVVYSSDPENPDSPDQIQSWYEWDEAQAVYTLSRTVRVAGDRLASEELSRMQAGGLESVTDALNGLWRMTSTAETGAEYTLFFDYQAGEIIFFNGDNEEVYEWNHSNLLHNGIYITASNQEIESLQRRIDVSFLSVEEASVRIQEDVTSIVSDSASWNGTYRKSSAPYIVYQDKAAAVREIQSLLSNGTGWETTENYSLTFDGTTYSILSGTALSDVRSGSCAFDEAGGDIFVQFDEPLPTRTSPLYKVSRGETGADGAEQIALQECSSLASGVVLEDRSPIILTAHGEPDAEPESPA